MFRLFFINKCASFWRNLRGLWIQQSREGGVWAQYFDDYPNVETAELASSSRSFTEFFLHAFGWKYAMDGKKAELQCIVFQGVGRGSYP